MTANRTVRDADVRCPSKRAREESSAIALQNRRRQTLDRRHAIQRVIAELLGRKRLPLHLVRQAERRDRLLGLSCAFRSRV
jgi:hypothetical protein